MTNTRLFGRLASGGIQHLVYQMQFQSLTPNAMILPLPVALPALETSVQFVSLKGYSNFFSDLAKGFPHLAPPPSLLLSRSMTTDNAAPAARLQVHEVGEFVASFVPTVRDFDRLDPQFVIRREIWEKLPEYADYGFAVFQLKELAGEPHPMAFQFSTRWPEKIFFPTVHIHDGEIHDREAFDHTLYLQHESFDKVVGRYRGPSHIEMATGFVRSKGSAEDFCRTGLAQGILDPKRLLHRKVMRGEFANQDVICEGVQGGLSGKKGFAPTTLSVPFAGLASVAGLAWILRRRMRLHSKP